MRRFVFLATFLAVGLTISLGHAQNYTSYVTGSFFDAQRNPAGGVCMMGGATEHDEAMRWFLQRADGGDILVLRASGEDGYNAYMYSELGVQVNSVETIVCHNAQASFESYIHTRIQLAEAIWFAGGDQWLYVSYWRNTPIDSLINDAIVNRNIVVGGTSAGMAILGKYYYSAQNGSVSSDEALSNPYTSTVTVDSARFLDVEYMQDVVTDSHFADRNRQGRHVVFLARILTDYGSIPRGIACNEYTAVCVDETGMARVYGDYPNYEEAAYFLQTNCELEDFDPERCEPNQSLNWNLGGQAVRVCKVYGTNTGANTFSLSDWETSSGGQWQNWFVNNGVWNSTAGVRINCDSIFSAAQDAPVVNKVDLLSALPNPFNPSTTIQFELSRTSHVKVTAYDIQGREVARLTDGLLSAGTHQIPWDCSACASGVYLIELASDAQRTVAKALLVR
ncbi:MAG: Type 1 glutamine amidotransferase-like domain-containing protein [Calditrichaeota bacterium]|nr:Type 1 glutamine amidotransferase-like domain-containing protein [Calditrichota bacterium]